MFGREAAKELDYVECYPEGFRPGTTMNKACIDAKVDGFPMWVINGQVKKPVGCDPYCAQFLLYPYLFRSHSLYLPLLAGSEW